MIVCLTDECLNVIRDGLRDFGVTNEKDIKQEMCNILWNRVKPIGTDEVISRIVNSPETGIVLLRRQMIIGTSYLSDVWFYTQYWERVYRAYGKGLNDAGIQRFVEYLKDRLTFTSDGSDRPTDEDIVIHLSNGRFDKRTFEDFMWRGQYGNA